MLEATEVESHASVLQHLGLGDSGPRMVPTDLVYCRLPPGLNSLH